MYLSLRRSFSEVTRGKNDSDRLRKLVTAAKLFDHTDSRSHDRDVKDGAVAIVCSILRSCSPFFIARSKEIQLCLMILLRLYRCSEERLCASFCTDGTTLILDLLELVEINYRLGKKGGTTLVLAQHIIDVLSQARAPLSMVKRQEELLSSLVVNIHGATGRFVMHLSLKIIASLSEHSQNKESLFKAGLLETVLVGSIHMYKPVREESARIIMNLALENRNKTDLVQGHNQSWLDVSLALARSSCVSTKAYAIQALGCVATIPENKVIMTQHKNGAVVDALLQSASSHLIPSQVCVSATRVIGKLICDATASQIGRHHGLLVTLSSLACRDDKLAVAAAMAVKKIATLLRSGELSHKYLLQALITMSYSRSTEVLKWTVKAYCEQSSFPRDRVQMIAHKGLLTSLTVLSTDVNEFVMKHALDALSALAGEFSNSHYFGACTETNDCTPQIADVANAKDMGVEKVLRCVTQDVLGSCRKQPRCYSPSLAQFRFDFSGL
jgi:hypothetical protein